MRVLDKQILIVGGSGFYGSALARSLGVDRVLRTYYKNKIEEGINFDLASSHVTDVLINYPNINKVIIAAGIIDFSTINQNPGKAHYHNVEFIRRLIDELADLKLFPIFISSESVFDGKEGNYVESDKTNPTFIYGVQKDLMEKYILEKFSAFQILRISKIFDSDLSGNTLVANWIKKLDENEDIYCANDNIFSPIHLNDLCELSKRIINKNRSGIYHISSLVGLNRKDMLRMVLDNYLEHNSYTGQIYYQSLNEFSGAENQPLNTSMNPTKAISETGFLPKNFDEWVKSIVKYRFSDQSWVN